MLDVSTASVSGSILPLLSLINDWSLLIGNLSIHFTRYCPWMFLSLHNLTQPNRFIQFSAPRQPSATSSPPSSSTSIRQPPPPPPSLHSTNFPPLRLPYNRAWNNNQYNNIPDINNLISNIVSQIISILMPQIQNMILNVLPSYYNGPK